TDIGSPIMMVDNENTEFTSAAAPIVKKWCTHTTKLRPAMMTIAPTMVLYPKICFWANEAMTSEKIPNAGSMTIYTSGCPHIQNRDRKSTRLNSSHVSTAYAAFSA